MTDKTNNLGTLAKLAGMATTAILTKKALAKTFSLGAKAVSKEIVKSDSINYKLDPMHTNVRFSIDHFGTSTNHGGFYGLEGDMVFDPDNQTGQIDLDIPLEKLQTGNKAFDKDLKSKDFFNANKYPTAHFTSTKFIFKKGKLHQIKGNLTLLKKTRPITLTASKFNSYPSPLLMAYVYGGDFETTIDRTDWGIDGYVKMGVSKKVKLVIQIEAAQQ